MWVASAAQMASFISGAMASVCSWFGLLLLGAAVMILISSVFATKRKHSNAGKLLRGPMPWPIIGSFHLLAGRPWHAPLQELSQKYGPIFLLQLGSKPVVVLSSPSLAKDIFITQDHLFAQRPSGEAVKRLFYGGTTLGTMANCPQWRHMRKFYVLELLHPKRLHSFKHIRDQEISSLLHTIAQQSMDGHAAINLSQHITPIPLNILLQMIMTTASFRRDAVLADDLRRKTGELHDMWVGGACIGDFIPCLKWMDWKLCKRMDVLHKSIDTIIKQVIVQHQKYRGEEDPLNQPQATEDFLDLLLAKASIGGQPLTEPQIKGVIQDVLAAGSDVTTGSLEWAMVEIICKPPVQKKLQAEIDQVVGGGDGGHGHRRVDEADLPNLKYLQAVVKEVYRLHPPAPVIGRQAPPDQVCNVGGYGIPKSATVLVNMLAIGRDGGLWKEADKFMPDRFEGSKTDVRGLDMELLPFGAGRRMCVGMNSGLAMVQLMVASLVQAFDWSLSIESAADQPLMGTGVFLRKAQPLIAFAKPRTHLQ